MYPNSVPVIITLPRFYFPHKHQAGLPLMLIMPSCQPPSIQLLILSFKGKGFYLNEYTMSQSHTTTASWHKTFHT